MTRQIYKHYKKGEEFTFYLKPIEVIETFGRIKRDQQGRVINIRHSSGNGGGLGIRKDILKFFSNNIPIKVRFDDNARGRNIFRSLNSQLFYEEWFYPITNNDILTDEMFEI